MKQSYLTLLFISFIVFFFLKPNEIKAQCVTGTEFNTAHPKRDMRGVFLPSVASITWPSNRNASPAVQQAELITILDEIELNGYNTIFLQVRPECDALYPSTIEPWSYWLTGAQGTAPNPLWDPLQFAIDESHARALDLHAWLNPYRAKRGTDTAASNHVTVTHPSWVFTASNNANLKILNPGLPAVTNYIVSIVEDLATRYNLDGIHFDDYFYPNNGMTTNQDSQTYIDENPSNISNIEDWRRDNVNEMIGLSYDAIQTINTAQNKNIIFGVSPSGIWKNGSPNGISGLEHFNALYCDPLAWMQADKVDYIAPQVYWKINSGGSTDYAAISQWWNDVAADGHPGYTPSGVKDTHVYMSQAYYKMLDDFSSWMFPSSEMQDQIDKNREASMDATFGQIAYRHNEIANNQKGINTALNMDQFQYKSFAPPIPGKDAMCANKPANVRFGPLKIMWDTPSAAPDGDVPTKYVVYAFDNAAQATSNKNDGSKILDIVAGNELELTQTQIDTKFIVVTSLDKNNNESGDFCNFPLPDITAQCLVTSLTAPTAKNNCTGSFTATTTTVFPILSDTVVTWDYDFGGGITFTQSQNVIFETEITEFTSTGWSNGTPHAGLLAKISDSYNTSQGSIDACACEVTNTGALTIESGDYLNVDGNITVDIDGSLIVEHQGSVVQLYDNATVTNNGSIKVQVSTAMLDPRDFMLIGNPMTLDPRADLAGFRLLVHDTAAFDMFNEQSLLDATNFVDTDNNDWSLHTGVLNPGEGYAYWAAPDLQTGGTFDVEFNDGTLNTGAIVYDITFGDNKNDSPNILANPYSSAIDTDMLIANNTAINEVYFWEHNTEPSNAFPGANSANFNMADISIRNAGAGVQATTGGVAPGQFMSTGQGFGIKAAVDADVTFTNAMRVTSNNNTLRSPESINRLWLQMKNDTYSDTSTMALAFTDAATADYDANYDSNRIATTISFYSQIAADPQGYIIQSREAFDNQISVNAGFSSLIDMSSTYTISLSQREGELIENAAVYLIDNVTNSVTELTSNSYTFESMGGNFPGRFTIQFVDDSILGTSATNDLKIALYPNPTDGVVNVQSPNASISAVSLMDLQGRVIRNHTNLNTNVFTLNMNSLNAAVYFVKIETDNGSMTKRVIKQ